MSGLPASFAGTPPHPGSYVETASCDQDRVRGGGRREASDRDDVARRLGHARGYQRPLVCSRHCIRRHPQRCAFHLRRFHVCRAPNILRQAVRVNGASVLEVSRRHTQRFSLTFIIAPGYRVQITVSVCFAGITLVELSASVKVRHGDVERSQPLAWLFQVTSLFIMFDRSGNGVHVTSLFTPDLFKTVSQR